MRVVFMGSPEFAVPALEALLAAHEVALVITQPDKPAGRGKKLAAPAVKRVAERAGVPVFQPRSARTDEFAQRLREAEPEICVVVAYGKILPPAVLAVAPRGCLNIHASILPKYRGAAPIQWAIAEGETETGVAIMQLDEGMDTGPVFLTRRIAIDETDTAGSLHDELASVGAAALLEALAGIEAGTLVAEPQDDAGASRAPMLRKADGEVDWSRPAREVRDRVRAFDPWPCATTRLRGQPLKLFAARLAEGQGRPGEVLAADADGLRVACGAGAVAIGEVQAAGKRRMPVAAFVAGHALPPGTILGE